MSNEDVIELGSSDDDAEPPLKKIKPLPNAMVHIPRKFRDITIKPVSQKIPNRNKASSIKVPNMHMAPNPFSSKPNMLSVSRAKLANKYPPAPKMVPRGLVISPGLCPRNIKILSPGKLQTQKALHNLPSSITVKKTQVPKRSFQIQRAVIPKVQIKKAIFKPHKKAETKDPEVLTVELDDDEAPDHKANNSPLWYLPPEDNKTLEDETKTLEKENNKEPDTKNLIEITIEDSPIKAVNKHVNEVGMEIAITIDDSPVKAVNEKSENASGSDSELKESNKKDYNSKKQLVYPDKEEENKICDETETSVSTEQVNTKETVEKMTVMEVCGNITDNNKSNEASTVVDLEDSPVVELEDSPKEKETHTTEVKEAGGEFHSTYQEFIDLCLKLENSDDMNKIVEKKIKAYYRQVPKEYTESEQFIDMVQCKIVSMKAGPDKMYLYIKDIVDELNLQRKLVKSQDTAKKEEETESNNFLYGEESEFDSKRQRQIRKLEKTLKKLHRAIQKLEEQEVDFDDEEDSVYLLTERYKERMVRVHAKFCQLTNTKMPSEPRIQIDARPGQPTGPAKRLEKWINRKVPIGTPLPFPDFHDVLRCVKEANTEDKLGWNDVDIMEEARDLFTRCGRKLQRRRQENEWRLAISRLATDVDPAEKNEELKKKLEENKNVATKKETEVLNKYTEKQYQLKLEAEEIGDKEAEESPVESEEEEEPNNEISLENTEKRKERLKRLLQERNRKGALENGTNKNETKQANEIEGDVCSEKAVENTQNNRNDGVEDSVTSKKTIDLQNTAENANKSDDVLKTLSDSNNIDSDIDELHLLQKLHSENEAYSSTQSDSPIAISDTLESASENEIVSDIISIENSSYSEAENDKNESTEISKEINTETRFDLKETTSKSTNLLGEGIEIEISNNGINTKSVSNNEEHIESIEDILLASSDENGDNDNENIDKDCVNLRDDAISIEENLLGSAENSSDNVISVEKNRNDNDREINTENMDSCAKSSELIIEDILSEESQTGSVISDKENNGDKTKVYIDDSSKNSSEDLEIKETNSL